MESNSYINIKKSVESKLSKIPEVITNEWLENELSNNESSFNVWGFCFENLINKKFASIIDKDIIRRINFSTRTIFPENSPFKLNKNMFTVNEDTKRLHEKGIDGRDINLAIIDQYFETKHYEINECIVSKKKCDSSSEDSFHGLTVSAQLCGKNLGIAPGSKLWFYGRSGVNNDATCSALKDIYNQNQNGANIRIVSISASNHRKSIEFEDIQKKLINQGCYIIDSYEFNKLFTSVNQDPFTYEYYYTDWQCDKEGKVREVFKNKIAIPTGGKMMPLIGTVNDYLYCSQASYSWAIPKLSGFFALALQINPDLTYEEFIQTALDTKIEKNNITLFNINGIISRIKKQKFK